MAASPSQRLYRALSSVVESSFLDVDDGAIHLNTHGTMSTRSVGEIDHSNFTEVVPSRAITESFRPQQKKASDRHLISFVVVYTMIFFNGCCFTAVVPSVPFYLQVLGAPPSFLGLVVSFYSLGQIIGSPIAGWLNDKLSSKLMLTTSSSLGIFASTLYAVAPNHWFILASRLLTGVSAGMEFTTELAFIARNTTTQERTTFLASVTAVNVVGFIIGPALTTVLAMLDVEFMGLTINQYTGPGWLLVAMFLLDLLMVQGLFQDSSLESTDETSSSSSTSSRLLKDEDKRDSSYGAVSKEEEMEEGANNDSVASDEEQPPSLTVVLSMIFIQFTVMCAWSVLETITSPLAFDQFGWHVQECNLLFTCGGAASLVAYVAFVVASKWIHDRWLIVYALAMCFIGLTMMITFVSELLPPYLIRFVVGYMVMNMGFMTGRPVTFALYSKLIPSQYQGKYLGWMVAGGSAARTLGPFMAVFLYYGIEYPGLNTLVLFGTEGAFQVACLVLVACLWSDLLPVEKRDGKKSPPSATGSISMHVDKDMDKNDEE